MGLGWSEARKYEWFSMGDEVKGKDARVSNSSCHLGGGQTSGNHYLLQSWCLWSPAPNPAREQDSVGSSVHTELTEHALYWCRRVILLYLSK